MVAIISADLVNSSLLSEKDFKTVITDLRKLLKDYTTDFYGGDSFRVLVEDPVESYTVMLKARLTVLQLNQQEETDIRMSLNIGKLHSKKVDLRSSMDELLVKSGRTFAKLQEGPKRTYISCDDDGANFTYEIIADYTDNILSRLTAKQAMVVLQMLSGRSQIETATILKLSAATVNKHVKAARYEEIKNLINKFRILTNKLQDGD